MSAKWISLSAMVLLLVLLTKVMKQKSGGGDIKLYLSLSFALGFFLFGVVLFATLILRWIHGLIKREGVRGKRFALCCYLAPAYILTLCVLAVL